jgi:hypothetical protein
MEIITAIFFGWIQVYDQKSTKSWLLGRDTAFIHHAVQHPHKQIMNHFYAAQSTKSEGTVKGCLCKWVYEEDAKRMKKIEVTITFIILSYEIRRQAIFQADLKTNNFIHRYMTSDPNDFSC